MGAIGEDVANMFPDAFFDGFVAPPLLEAMEESVSSAKRFSVHVSR